jgi:hypothetical protein
MSSPDSNEMTMKAVYLLIVGFLLALVGGIAISFLIALIGAILIIVGALWGYVTQPRVGSAAGIGMPALHRELAKTHCGQCGASMRSNMMFCPSCGAKQTPVQA